MQPKSVIYQQTVHFWIAWKPNSVELKNSCVGYNLYHQSPIRIFHKRRIIGVFLPTLQGSLSKQIWEREGNCLTIKANIMNSIELKIVSLHSFKKERPFRKKEKKKKNNCKHSKFDKIKIIIYVEVKNFFVHWF